MKRPDLRTRFAIAFALGVVLALQFSVQVFAEQPVAVTQYIVRFALKRGLPGGSVKEKTLKIEAQPTIAAIENKDCSFRVGGEVKVGREFVFYGTQVDFILKPVAEGQVLIEGKIELSQLANPNLGLVVKEATDIHFSQPVVLNKQTVFTICKTEQESRWLEVLIEPVAAQARAGE